MTGFVNHLFWNGIVPLVGRERALLWPKKLGIISKNYHGEIFEGNACRELLEQSDKLNDKDIYGNLGEYILKPFINCFKTMDKIVTSCFSMKRKDDNLSNNINELKKHLSATTISETLKIHVLLVHLDQCLNFLENKRGLGFWSEQAGESVHRVFKKFWSRRKMNLISDPKYITRLKAAVVEFTSKHL